MTTLNGGNVSPKSSLIILGGYSSQTSAIKNSKSYHAVECAMNTRSWATLLKVILETTLKEGKKSKLGNVITKYWLLYSILWIQMIPKHIIKQLNECGNLCRKTDWYLLTIKGKMTHFPQGLASILLHFSNAVKLTYFQSPESPKAAVMVAAADEQEQNSWTRSGAHILSGII